jgi:lipopolysaccharide transport system ATP-binding protein
MMETVISVENVGKSYRLGSIGGGTLAGDLNRWWAGVRRRPDPLMKVGETDYGNRQGEMIWALRDLSFEVKRGEIVGVIGRNGAGKSTLLKILSRVTAPTTGQIKVDGRIASLLEVGTGFHPELTGRENIYLNGAILGMDRGEINRKFDEIVEFSEVEKFIDTPVKRYSSGMYVRLAFAVAAHLEPEILLVDEVLAVGDVAFQKKCLGKMGNVAREGRTILFVSHNMAAILELCPDAILLDGGRVVGQGSSTVMTQQYLKLIREKIDVSFDLKEIERSKSYHLRGNARLLSCKPVLLGEQGSWNIDFGQPIEFEIEFEAKRAFESLELGIGIFAATGFEICSVVSSDDMPWNTIHPGVYKTKVSFPDLRLLPGSYKIGMGLRSNEDFEDYLPELAYFDIILSKQSTELRTRYRKGVIAPRISISLSPR